jgi:hypothetical protein
MTEQYLYQTFGRIAFVVSLAIILLPSIVGVKEDPINIMYVNYLYLTYSLS